MDGIKYAVFTDKSIRLLGKNQYTSNVELGSTRTEIKHWVELFFGVKVIAMKSHRLPRKGRRMGPIYYGTYNALQTYDHYASIGLFYSTS
uniref:ribosomal protein L23 n=1 Tax=Paronychia argentea TaxID=157622 RepID=UPI0021823E9A|nr:ribosomal protein L23 [Paronychia argentea]YP_010467899.1 ribosomal protein L23 [Paronychia argentea]UVF30398.1 ribosomal protein L23 [Paronychia argentea]UVF30420.1 ribosomal protein L23 [Paronychia argentea]UVF31237.1 ribosomal protein L23 [Paronychia argentea]UVF31259.1 ribosomal protein L23 [Paronychia argentea]